MAKIMMLLAQGPGKPDGDLHQGLVLRASLNKNDHIDVAAYEADPLPWRARRFWLDKEDWYGHLILVDEGEWGLLSEKGDNEPVWNLTANLFRPGEYVTLTRPDHAELTFRIVGIENE